MPHMLRLDLLLYLNWFPRPRKHGTMLVSSLEVKVLYKIENKWGPFCFSKQILKGASKNQKIFVHVRASTTPKIFLDFITKLKWFI